MHRNLFFQQSVVLLSLLIVSTGLGSPAANVLPEGATPQQAAILKKKAGQKAVIKPAPVTASTTLLEQVPSLTNEQLAQQSVWIKERHQAIVQELADQQDEVVKDLTFLWQAAVDRSAAIRYAVEKLSQRDASGKPVANDGRNRRILKSIAQLGGAAGSMWTGTPVGLLSGSLITQVLNETQPTASGRVTDADMVILAKAVEDLQRDVMTSYYHYRFAKQRQALAEKAVADIQQHYVKALKQSQQSAQRAHLEVLLSSAMASVEQQAKQADAQAHQMRNSLALLVGAETITAMELAQPTNESATQTQSRPTNG